MKVFVTGAAGFIEAVIEQQKAESAVAATAS
jgi:hypothetical protein